MIYKLLKFCDENGPKMGEIYERMDNMLRNTKDVMIDNKYTHEFSQMETILVTMWYKMTISLHYLGFCSITSFL